MNIMNANDGEITVKVIRTTEFHRGDVYRLSENVTEIHVLSGRAWVTVPNKDIVLRTGEVALLVHGKHDAVLSPLGDSPLIVEELG